MQRLHLFFSTLFALVALGLPGCSRQQPVTAPEVVSSVPAEPVRPVVNKVFSDPDMQDRYAAEFQRHLDLFEPLSTGTIVALRLKEGAFIGGALTKLDAESVLLRLNNKEYSARIEDLDPLSHTELFQEAFARQHARAAVKTTPPDAAGPVIATRYAVSDGVTGRVGPGRRFIAVPGTELVKGAPLKIRHEQGLWLFATADDVPGKSFWIHRFETKPLQESDETDLTRLVMQLVEEGWVSRVDMEQGHVYVPRGAWQGIEPAWQEGLSRMMATHLSRAKQSATVWVDIRDEDGGQRLGRYSKSQGFRTF